MAELHFLGVPFNSDGTPPKVEHPPQHLRNAGMLDRLSLSRSIRNCGDLPIPAADGVRDSGTGVLNWSSWQAVTGSVAKSIREILAAGKQLGGSASGERLERMQASPNFRAGKAQNPVPTDNSWGLTMMWETIKDYRGGHKTEPDEPPPIVRLTTEAFAEKPTSGLRVTWLGHSSVLGKGIGELP